MHRSEDNEFISWKTKKC